MSLRFIGGLTVARRVAIATGLAASFALTTPAAADERVTALLRGGERVTGRFDGFTNGLIHIDVSDTDERKIPVGDVALLDLVGAAQGLPETELREARGDDHLLLLKSGNAVKGRLVSIEGSEREKSNPQPTTVWNATSQTFPTTSNAPGSIFCAANVHLPENIGKDAAEFIMMEFKNRDTFEK